MLGHISLYVVCQQEDHYANTHYGCLDPKTNDYFGLIFIGGDQQLEQLTMYTNNQVEHPEKQFKISVTSDGIEWVRQ